MRKDCGNCVYAKTCRQQSCPAALPSPWYETPEEVEAGLAWGERKSFLMRWVRRHMANGLSRRQQQVVELYLFRGMTRRQIARLTRMDRGYVNRALRRSVVRLKRLWIQQQQPEGTASQRKRPKPGGGKSPGPA